MAYSSYQNSDNIVPYYMAFVADYLADVENLPIDCAPGSQCIVVEDGSLWILNNQYKWCLFS